MHARPTGHFAVLLQYAVVLLLVAASAAAFAQAPQRCDANGDGFVSLADIKLIVAARNTPASGPNDPRDANGSGRIDALDARTCQQRCTLPRCALPANVAPVALDDSYVTPEDSTLVVMAPGVLGNDTDADGNPLTASVVTGPASGTLVLSANGSFSYMPAPDFSGPVTFTYRTNDGALDSNVATVTLDVIAQDDGPVASADTYDTAEDTPLVVPAPGVLANDTDADGNPLTALLVSGPAASAGTVTLGAGGSVTFTPAANFTGAATFTYRASDGTLQSGVTTVTINVVPNNDAPMANADAYGTDEDVPLVVAAPGVLGNDVDSEGSGLTATVETNPASGTLVLNPNGSFTYTPALNFTGPASFTYRASDGALASTPSTVSITVLPVNDAPVAANDSYSTPANTALNVAGSGVLGNDTDQEGAGLIAVVDTGPANGALALNANGSFVYAPSAGFTGSDSFTYRANDGTLPSNLATVNITVTPPANTAPVAIADSYTVAEGGSLAIGAATGVLANDTDADGDALTAILVGTAPAGFALAANGGFTYTPPAGFSGTATAQYKANDGTADSNTVNVTLNVTVELPTVTVTASTPTANEAGPVNGAFTFTRSGGNLAASLSVAVATSGTASNIFDYQAIANVSIPAGQTSVVVPVAPFPDNLVEGDETVIVTVQPNAAYTIGAQGAATVTIADSVAVVQVTASTPTANEAGPVSGAFTFTRSGGNLAASLSVSVAKSGTASQIFDYEPVANVSIPAGQTSVVVPVVPIPDNVAEGNETVIFTIQPNAEYTIGAQGAATVTIADSAAVVQVTATTPTASEAGPVNGAFTFTRSGGNLAASLSVSVAKSGTASQIFDYEPVANVSIPAGQTSVVVPVVPIADNQSEGDETVIFTIQPSAAYTIGAPSSATVTIADQ